jgi:hypothetical protein
MNRSTPAAVTSSHRAARRRGLLSCGLLAAAVLVAGAGSARAQEPAGATAGGSVGPLGVGASAMLTGPIGPSVVYDAGLFHIEGILGFASNGATDFALGGRFWYHIHTAQSADFSLGGGVGVTSTDPDGPDEGTTDVHIDVGAQIRVFLVPNVALSAAAGLAIISGDDADLVGVFGDLVGDAGITYYF